MACGIGLAFITPVALPIGFGAVGLLAGVDFSRRRSVDEQLQALGAVPVTPIEQRAIPRHAFEGALDGCRYEVTLLHDQIAIAVALATPCGLAITCLPTHDGIGDAHFDAAYHVVGDALIWRLVLTHPIRAELVALSARLVAETLLVEARVGEVVAKLERACALAAAISHRAAIEGDIAIPVAIASGERRNTTEKYAICSRGLYRPGVTTR